MFQDHDYYYLNFQVKLLKFISPFLTILAILLHYLEFWNAVCFMKPFWPFVTSDSSTWNTRPSYPPVKSHSSFKPRWNTSALWHFFLKQEPVTCLCATTYVPPSCHWCPFRVCLSLVCTELFEVRDYFFVYSALNMVPRMYEIFSKCLMKGRFLTKILKKKFLVTCHDSFTISLIFKCAAQNWPSQYFK